MELLCLLISSSWVRRGSYDRVTYFSIHCNQKDYLPTFPCFLVSESSVRSLSTHKTFCLNVELFIRTNNRGWMEENFQLLRSWYEQSGK